MELTSHEPLRTVYFHMLLRARRMEERLVDAKQIYADSTHPATLCAPVYLHKFSKSHFHCVATRQTKVKTHLYARARAFFSHVQYILLSCFSRYSSPQIYPHTET